MLTSTLDLIGNTPLVRLKGPSDAAGCDIFGKCEFANPGASVKDRAALYIVRDAERQGLLQPGGTIVEGTAGNTGIGLALVANALGYKTIIVMPETQSQEKKDTLRALGAELVLVPAAPYSNPGHFVHTSRRIAEESRERHQTVEAFLRSLGVSADTARIDADGIEHHVSAETLDAFRRALSRPR